MSDHTSTALLDVAVNPAAQTATVVFGPARTSVASAGSSTSGGPNSRITTARTPGLLHETVLPRQTSLKAFTDQRSGPES